MQASRSGGAEPRWSSGGRELVFRHERSFMSVSFADAVSGRLGEEHVLFAVAARGGGGRDPSYSILPDDRFLVFLEEETSSSAVTVLLNRLGRLPTTAARLK